MAGHDDLAPWDDDPLVRALREPGTTDELSGEADFVAAFRAAQSTAHSTAGETAQPTLPTPLPTGRDRLRRAGRRLGGGGTAVVVAVALGAGAAAAYSQKLPDPVQRAVHGVLGPVGVPGPATPSDTATKIAQAPDPTTSAPGSAAGEPTDDPAGSPSRAPTQGPSGSPSSNPSATPSESATESPTESSTASPTEIPTEIPTETPTETPVPVAPASVALVGMSHRTAPDEQVPLSGTVTASDGAPVAGQPVTLFQRQGRAWNPVGTATSDESGSVSLVAPELARTSVFRLGVGDALTSQTWRIALTPSVTLANRSGSGSTGLVVTVRGARPGDQVSLMRKRPGPDVLVGRARLADDLSTTFLLPPSRERATFVARLPRSRAHTAAMQELRVLPPKPAAITASAPVDTLGPRDSVTVSGTVTSSDGVALPGRPVWLLLRSPGSDWRRVGSATSDSTGAVSIAVGPIDRSSSVRLRVGEVRSPVLRLRLRPAWSASVSPGGDGQAIVAGTVAGSSSGDTVLLRKLVGGRLITVQQTSIGPDGAVSLAVPRPEARKDRYRLVLARTPMHLRAMTTVLVPAR